ncbi:methyltransferase domain-containing protein [bacterium]|nr:methyltransferase domain-containing protein [bacterium]MCI0607381.1 methyltransferase domain-containing protein [bacterium]
MPDNPSEAGSPNFDRVAAAWEKWEDWLEPSYRSFNEIFIKTAGVRAGHQVLDIGCGSGYPSIQEAQQVGIQGSVTGLDISEPMLEVAMRRAKLLGLTNIQFKKCDVDILPFPENHFDAATARFCLMFVSAPCNTLREVLRVLKAGAWFSASVWARQEKNPLPRTILERYYDLPPGNTETPGPYRFARSGALAQMLEETGFQEPTEKEVLVNEVFLTGRQYVEHLLEASALWGSLLLKLDAGKLKEATEALVSAAEEFRAGTEIHIPRCAFIVSARK